MSEDIPLDARKSLSWARLCSYWRCRMPPVRQEVPLKAEATTSGKRNVNTCGRTRNISAPVPRRGCSSGAMSRRSNTRSRVRSRDLLPTALAPLAETAARGTSLTAPVTVRTGATGTTTTPPAAIGYRAIMNGSTRKCGYLDTGKTAISQPSTGEKSTTGARSSCSSQTSVGNVSGSRAATRLPIGKQVPG